MARINKSLPRPRAKPGQASTMVVQWYGDKLIENLFKEQNAALFAAGEILINAAAAKAPRDKGTLAESGYVSTLDKSSYRFDPKSYEKEVNPKIDGLAAIGFAAPHAHLIEYGTSNMVAQPFFRPAFDENRREMGFVAAGFLRKAIENEA